MTGLYGASRSGADSRFVVRHLRGPRLRLQRVQRHFVEVDRRAAPGVPRPGVHRSAIDLGALPPELSDAKFLLLVDRASGGMLGVTLFDSEEAMRKGDETGRRGLTYIDIGI
jgi:hypothetical protein